MKRDRGTERLREALIAQGQKLVTGGDQICALVIPIKGHMLDYFLLQRIVTDLLLLPDTIPEA